MFRFFILRRCFRANRSTPTVIHTLSLHDALPIFDPSWGRHKARIHPIPGDHDYVTSGAAGYFGYFGAAAGDPTKGYRSEEHTSELQSRENLVCRLLLEKTKIGNA